MYTETYSVTCIFITLQHGFIQAGILPKEKPRTQTVRDVKKRETERRSRDRYRISSDEYASEELPAGENLTRVTGVQ